MPLPLNFMTANTKGEKRKVVFEKVRHGFIAAGLERITMQYGKHKSYRDIYDFIV